MQGIRTETVHYKLWFYPHTLFEGRLSDSLYFLGLPLSLFTGGGCTVLSGLTVVFLRAPCLPNKDWKHELSQTKMTISRCICKLLWYIRSSLYQKVCSTSCGNDSLHLCKTTNARASLKHTFTRRMTKKERNLDALKEVILYCARL